MDPLARQSDLALLHPKFRGEVAGLVSALHSAGLPLEPFETARTPERQVELFKQGRMAGYGKLGHHVTWDVAWTSRHQYGLAVDLVFKVAGQWTWNEPNKGDWQRFQDLAARFGLQAVRNAAGAIIEWPHVQDPWPLIKLRAGEYPPGGDRSWADFFNASVFRWGTAPHRVGATDHPGAPPRAELEAMRPPLGAPCFPSP